MPIRAFARWLPFAALTGVVLVSNPSSAEAQFGRRLKDAVKRTAEDKAITKATEEESKTIDKATAGGGDSASGDTATAAAETGAASSDGASTETAAGEASGEAAPAAPKERKI